MFLNATAICLISLAQPASTSVVYRDGEFLVRLGQQTHTVKTSGGKVVPRVVHKVGERFAVWDDRGVTVRDGDWTHSTLFEDAALSPKLFARDQILQTKTLLESGRRQKPASRLAGTLLVESVAYFLPRWEDFDGTPWLECLFSVDLAAPKPVPRLEGKYEGFTVTPGPDGLGKYEESIFAIIRTQDRWGYGFFVPTTGGFGFLSKGDRAETVAKLSNTTAIVVERSPYGTRLVKRFHLPSGVARLVAEVRGAVTIISVAPPVIDVDAPGGRFLRNLDTGAEKPQSRGTPLVGIAGHVLVWSPRDQPDLALLYDPASWTIAAEWKR